jgi:hypothetical protein
MGGKEEAVQVLAAKFAVIFPIWMSGSGGC